MKRTSLRHMNPRQRKVLDACYNGWWLSGRYSAQFDGHRRMFEADSPTILFDDVDRWFQSHAEHHANDNVLVRCVQPL